MVLVRQLLYLLRRDAQEGKHSNLIGNVVPIILVPQVINKQPFEISSHSVDPICHALDLLEPLLV